MKISFTVVVRLGSRPNQVVILLHAFARLLVLGSPVRIWGFALFITVPVFIGL